MNGYSSMYGRFHIIFVAVRLEWIWIVNHHISLLLWSGLLSFGPIEMAAQGAQDAVHDTALFCLEHNEVMTNHGRSEA
jgi:hypothetical protein